MSATSKRRTELFSVLLLVFLSFSWLQEVKMQDNNGGGDTVTVKPSGVDAVTPKSSGVDAVTVKPSGVDAVTPKPDGGDSGTGKTDAVLKEVSGMRGLHFGIFTISDKKFRYNAIPCQISAIRSLFNPTKYINPYNKKYEAYKTNRDDLLCCYRVETRNSCCEFIDNSGGLEVKKCKCKDATTCAP